MTRDQAVKMWREVCGSDTVMACGIVTGRMLEEFAARIEAAERERCASLCEEISDEYQRREGMKYPELKTDAQEGARECAAAIRKA